MMPETPKRSLALIAYLVPVFGWGFVVLFERKDTFSLFHACQALVLNIALLVLPALWATFAWLVNWVPLGGAPIAAASFALVVAGYIGIALAWVFGMVSALRAELNPVPIFGGWGMTAVRLLAPSAG